ncbi:acyl-CoA dehydrogenase [Chromatiales bacterium (ex Bugula neritina AB1)]|nr:acyl-CoA dehydrogenase [Chromatiales bacterium (ex Bugula neritina AB1)]
MLMTILFGILIFLAMIYYLANFQQTLKTISIAVAVGMVALTLVGVVSGWVGVVIWLLLIAIAVVMNVESIRLQVLSAPLLRYVRAVLPPMSQTERDAIEAGTVWWEAELFRGNPDWSKLMSTPQAGLSAAEQAFLDGPTNELCKMLDDWEITYEHNDLPPHIWDFIKKNRFFGMVIPEEYGGLGFSAFGHSAVVTRISARSVTAGSTVMVPNSLGPAELLLHYGTDEQRNHYLPKLAVGEELPCFALTGPSAGSDAASLPDYGIVCKQMHEGKETLGLRVNWDKRYITLGPVATIVGLAFKAYDPDHLLGDQEDLGITCALIPAGTPGVTIGRRHFPLNQAFMNGPNSGKDVFVPLEWIIGGRDNIGQGWRMLMESLSTGRGISLPSSGAAAGMAAARFTGAYARVRKQFNIPIGKFEGVDEALARIGGLTYLMDAGRRLTCAALDQGERPSVVSGILKYFNTHHMRSVLNDAMDIHGGKGICMGPGNYLARAYQGVPVGITVEGANILTRSMIVFGQGAMRCHPHLVAEIEAASLPDEEKALEKFDTALLGHIAYAVSSGAQAMFHGLTRGRFAQSPVSGPTAKYFRRLARMSAAYSFLADFTLLFLGGELKRKEKLSGRFADGLIYMYMGSAVLKRYEDDGRPEADLPLVEWGAKYCIYETQVALDQILRNFPSRTVGLILRGVMFPLGRRFKTPNDRLSHQMAKLLLEPGASRDRLTGALYISEDPDDVTGCLEVAMKLAIEADPIEKDLKDRGFSRPYDSDYESWIASLSADGTLSAEQARVLIESAKATHKVISVDDFEREFRQSGMASVPRASAVAAHG